MNHFRIRKIVILLIIVGMLIPLSFVSRPATRDRNDEIVDRGGVLSDMRLERGLSQTRLSQVDPTSEAMKLALLGMRGVAVNILWLQATDHKMRENYDQLEATLNTLIKIQPNFIKVWEYQAHNLSYNVSVEFDDYEHRYHWVKKGIRFLTEGLQYNVADHRMTDNLGSFTGMKIGNSDEKYQFRRIFRFDEEFHQDMAKFIDPELYDTPEYGPDHWKMAYYWFDKSRRMVEERKGPQLISDLMFYSKRPSQLRNQAMGLQNEFRTDEIVRAIWAESRREWLEYGEQKISNTLGQVVTLNGTLETAEQLDRLRAQLDAFAPGLRDEYQGDIRRSLRLTDEQYAILDLPADQRTQEQSFHVESVLREIERRQIAIDAEIFRQLPEEQKLLASPIFQEISRTNELLSAIDKHQGTINYRYWVAHNETENSDITVDAHQKLFDARENRRRSIFDNEYRVDRRTNERQIIQKGAIGIYEDSYVSWAQVFENQSLLVDGSLGHDVADSMKEYRKMLGMMGLEWPDNFPLQSFIDFRATRGENDEVPTSQELEEIRSRSSSGVDQESQFDDDSDSDKSDVDNNDETGDRSDSESDDGQN